LGSPEYQIFPPLLAFAVNPFCTFIQIFEPLLTFTSQFPDCKSPAFMFEPELAFIVNVFAVPSRKILDPAAAEIVSSTV